METRSSLFPITALVVFAVLGIALARADQIKNTACLECHSDKTLTTTNSAGKEISLYVDVKRLAGSVHATNSCASCHSDITSKHPDDNVRAQAVTCGKCHSRQFESYGASVHGVAKARGQAQVATCSDCHGGHSILRPTSPESPLHFSKLAQTCGACHAQESKDVEESIHGQALAAGHRDAPTCTDCHSGHKIVGLKENSSLAISTEVCSRCHASQRLNTKYQMPADRVKTFFESYHGLAAQYGSTIAANCGSCHGAHKILPSKDPRSTIHANHLVETCGKCHPGATDKFVEGKMHVDAASAQAGVDVGQKINWWVRRLYLGLIVVVIGAMLLHNGLAFGKKVAARYRAADHAVLRMDLSQRMQHLVLGLSFVVLALTGFALKFPDSWLAKCLGSHEDFRRWSHRIAGLILLGIGAYHLVYILCTKEGRCLMKDMFPVKKDVQDAWINGTYLLGARKEKPKFARFGYAEKMEYWAVIWGTIIMGFTGMMIWFKMGVTHFLPRWAVDVALTIHYYEAILACLAIVVWHFYHVIFDPDVYPFNSACLNGKVSRNWQQEEHPLDKPCDPTATEVPSIEVEEAVAAHVEAK